MSHETYVNERGHICTNQVSVLQCVAVDLLQCVAIGVLQFVAVCCNWCVAVYYS